MASISNEELLHKLIDEKERNKSKIVSSKAILVKVTYLIEDDTGELNKKDIDNKLWNEIPDNDIVIDDNHKAVWQSTSKLFLDSGSMNCGRCTKCQGWTTDREKPNWIEGLCNGATVNGELLCDECLPKGHYWSF